MDEQAPNYHSEFFKSPHHAAFGVLTLGLGFLSAQLLPLIIGATIYTLGWIYLPDLPFFRRFVDRRRQSAAQVADAQRITEFVQRREAVLRSLSPEGRQCYNRLAAVCRDIENASADNLMTSANAATDPRLRKLDELMWTYLRLLGIQESLQKFLENERRENLPSILKGAETEARLLETELAGLKTKGDSAAVDTKQRYLSSRLERLEVLRKRQERFDQAEANAALVVSEQDRLEQQIKLIRADAVATRNAQTLTARIDATVEHLDQTNKWLSELDEFKDMVGDLPNTETRVGYEAFPLGNIAAPPPVIEPRSGQKRTAGRQQQAG